MAQRDSEKQLVNDFEKDLDFLEKQKEEMTAEREMKTDYYIKMI